MSDIKVQPNDKFKVSCMDNFAYYVVIKVTSKTIHYKLDPDVPDSYTDAILGSSGSQPYGKIAPLVKQAKMWANLIAEADAQKTGLEVGSTIHYVNRRGDYVRGEVVADETKRNGIGFKSLALVGDWKHDTPRRQPDGEVYYPYHAKKVKEQEVGEIPNCIVELEPRYLEEIGGQEAFDALPVVSIEVPEMTDEEKENARLYKLAKKAAEILGNAAENPKESLEAAVAFIENGMKAG